MARYKQYLDKGDRIGSWTVLHVEESSRHDMSGKKRVPSSWKYFCECDCGAFGTPTKKNMTQGYSLHCGCKSMKYKKVLHAGDIFGYLTILKSTEPLEIIVDYSDADYLCRCKCGNEIIANRKNIVRGGTTSCGCYSIEMTKLSNCKQNVITFEDDMALIHLYNGNVGIVDREDYQKVCEYYWTGGYDCNRYISTSVQKNGKKVQTKLHRLITECPTGKVVDHINLNPLDNRKENLRICSQGENVRNCKVRCASSCGHKGVHYDASFRKWIAQISSNGEKHYLGSYSHMEDALQARKDGEKKYHGEFAYKGLPQ